MRNFLSFLFFSIASFSFAQTNLIPNPDFESYSQCPDALTTPTTDQVMRVTGWSSWRDTPDYFNVCCPNGVANVPLNSMGYQTPHSGNAYCGGVTYNKNSLFREIIGRQLTSPLVIGQKYFVSFYVCLSGKPGLNYATNKMGAKFTTTPYNYNSNPIAINNLAQVHYDTLITDTTNWKLVFGSFIADSAYQYVAFGNFFDDAHTDTLCIASQGLTLDGYYYIDDVCLSTDSLYAKNWTGINESQSAFNTISVFPNPANSILHLENSSSPQKYVLVNSLGQLILSGELKHESEELDISAIERGVYFLKFENNQVFKILLIH